MEEKIFEKSILERLRDYWNQVKGKTYHQSYYVLNRDKILKKYREKKRLLEQPPANNPL
jgi:hypothetical protein